MPAVRDLTLVDLAAPRAGVFTNLALVVGASIVTGIAAQLAVPLPWTPVPLTGQTFAVLLTGALLGSTRGFLAQGLYLLEGAAGLPVFAGGDSGVMKLIGPTAGYLLAFPFAAAVTGALAQRGWDRNFFSMLAAMMLGSVVIFAGGLLGLSRYVPGDRLLAAGLLPFLPGDLIKSSLAALAFPAVWSWLGRRSGSDA